VGLLGTEEDPVNKRSAVLIAAGLVLTLAVGGLAVSLGLTGPTPVDAAGARPERVVKVQRSTVTVHRKADAAAGSATQISIASPVTSDDSDDGFEGEDEFEDEFEGEDREDHEESEDIEVEDD
jgi:hypothetical protein